jgi:succinyl-diaminopimelate desuccinylase
MMSSQFDKICSFIDGQDGFIIDVMKRLLEVDTTVPSHDTYSAFVPVLESYYSRLGFDCERVILPREKAAQIRPEVTGDRINLVASKDTGKSPCCIYAHMDTVPIGSGWKHDPFGEVADGRIYGRGAVDMKGSIGSLFLALETISRLNVDLRCDVIGMMCSDEELGVYPGSRYLAEQGYFKGELVWLEAGMQAPVGLQGSVGNVEISIRSIGKASHSGMNYLGVNAVEAMVPVMDELLKLKELVEQRQSSMPVLPGPGVEQRNIRPSLNLDIIRGGEKANVIPAECTLVIDRRYIPEERFEDVEAELREALACGKKRSKALGWEIDIVHCYAPAQIDVDGPCARRMRRALQTVHGYKDDDIVVGGLQGSTDLGFVTGITGNMDVAGTGPFSMETLSTFHQPDEFATIADLKNLAKMLVCYLMNE